MNEKKKIAAEKLQKLRSLKMKEARLHAELESAWAEFRQVKAAAYEEVGVISGTPRTRGLVDIYHDDANLMDDPLSFLDLDTGEITFPMKMGGLPGFRKARVPFGFPHPHPSVIPPMPATKEAIVQL